jgi:hypothetical protein
MNDTIANANSFTDLLNGIADWQFLQEPLYRWALFILALSMILFGYNGILSLMK